MSTDTKRPPRSSATNLLSVPCQFGNVNVGDETARLTLKIDRRHLNVEAASELLCGKRLACRMVLGSYAEADGQSRFIEDMDTHVEATVDAKGFAVKLKHIGTGLSLALDSIDVADLLPFAKRAGRLIVLTAEALADDASDDEEE